MAEALSSAQRDGLSHALVAWFHLRKRSLPWRDEPAPYRVWVSEIMLQQTQVETVKPYFERFIDRFPDVQALAAASLDDVLSAWSGLGYYRRARYLHAGAIAVTKDHGGIVPDTVPQLLAVPGIGRYTAGAIASIAFGRAEPLVDGNVQRVLSRLIALPEAVDGTIGTKRLWALATELVQGSEPSAHNQGLMELGALICTPTKPNCGACPWRDDCAAHTLGRETDFPVKTPRKAPRTVHAVAGLLRPAAASNLVLFAQRPETGLLAGLWGLPMIDLVESDDPTEPIEATSEAGRALADHVQAIVSKELSVGRVVARVFHQFTHRSLHLDIVELTPRRGPLSTDPLGSGTGARWLTPQDAGDAVALSTLTRKVLTALRKTSEPRQLELSEGRSIPRAARPAKRRKPEDSS